MSYKDLLAQDRRLVILQLLEKSPGYKASQQLLYSALPGFGHEVSLDLVGTDIAWLYDNGCVHTALLGDVTVATLTQFGQDVAAGRISIPGVRRPGPSD